MRLRNSWILFLVATLLAGYYLLVERPRQRERDATLSDLERLSAFDPSDVVHLSVTRPGEVLEFSAAGTGWEMVRPVHDAADTPTVITLLSAWADAGVSRDLGPPEDATRYGLDDPVVLTASLAAGGTVSLFLGGYTVDRAFVYASRRRGGDVLLIPTGVRRYAAVEVEDFRNKRVIALDPSVVDSFDVVSPARTMRWIRDPRDPARGWETRQGAHTIQGDPDAIDTLLRALRGLRARRFPPDAETDRMFSPPDHPADERYVRIHKTPPLSCQLLSLTLGNGVAFARLLEYTAAGEGPGVLVPTPGNGRVVEVDGTAMSVFASSVPDLREKRLLRFDRARLVRVSLTSPDTIATLVRAGDRWTYPNPALGAMNAAGVRAVLDAIAGLKAPRVLGEAPATLGGEPTFTLALFDDGGTLIDELSCRREAGGARTALATSRSLPVLCEIASSDLDRVVDAIRRINR